MDLSRMIAPKSLLRRPLAAARLWPALCSRRFSDAIKPSVGKTSVGAAAALLGRLVLGLAAGRAGLVMHHLPHGALAHEQVAGDEVAVGDDFETDHQCAVAEDG